MIFTKIGYTKRYLFKHPTIWLIWRVEDIRCAWQRAVRGYSWRDIKDMDYWFFEIIPQMLKEFKKKNTDSFISQEEINKCINEFEELLKYYFLGKGKQDKAIDAFKQIIGRLWY